MNKAAGIGEEIGKLFNRPAGVTLQTSAEHICSLTWLDSRVSSCRAPRGGPLLVYLLPPAALAPPGSLTARPHL